MPHADNTVRKHKTSATRRNDLMTKLESSTVVQHERCWVGNVTEYLYSEEPRRSERRGPTAVEVHHFVSEVSWL